MSAPVRYWRVSPKFWDTVVAEGWSTDAIVVGLYLLTCRHRTTEGLFRLPPTYILVDLEWEPERLSEPLSELVDKGFVTVDEGSKWVLIPGALKYQAPENPNQVTSAARRLAEVPENCTLTSEFRTLAERYCKPLADALETLPGGFGEPIPKPIATARANASGDQPFLEGSGPLLPVNAAGDGDPEPDQAANLARVAELKAARNAFEETA